MTKGVTLDSALNPKPFSSVLNVKQRHWLVGPHVDYQLSRNNTVSLRYLWTHADNPKRESEVSIRFCAGEFWRNIPVRGLAGSGTGCAEPDCSRGGDRDQVDRAVPAHAVVSIARVYAVADSGAGRRRVAVHYLIRTAGVSGAADRNNGLVEQQIVVTNPLFFPTIPGLANIPATAARETLEM